MRSCLRACLFCLLVVVSGGGQTVTKNWRNRAEFDLYDRIQQESSSTEKLKLLSEWKKLYPDSDYRQERLGLFVRAYDSAGRGDEAFAAAKELLEVDPSDLFARGTLCYWGPRLKDPPAGATELVKKAASELLARIDEVAPEYSTRRNLDSLFQSMETGMAARLEKVPNRKAQRAEVERIAGEALEWPRPGRLGSPRGRLMLVRNISQAKAELSALVAQVQKGAEVILAKAGKPVANLVPYRGLTRPRTPGSMAGQIWIAPDFDTLPEDTAKAFGMREPRR